MGPLRVYGLRQVSAAPAERGRKFSAPAMGFFRSVYEGAGRMMPGIAIGS